MIGTYSNIKIDESLNTNDINISDSRFHFFNSYHTNNIIGPKQSKAPKKIKLEKHLKVKLQNIRPYLSNTKRFCDKCLILFPNRYSLNYHKLNDHDVTYNYGKSNYEIKTKGQMKKDVKVKPFELQTSYVPSLSKGCFHCNKQFPNQQDLIDHMYSVLYTKKMQSSVTPGTTAQTEIKSTNKTARSDLQKEKKNESNNFYSCPICSYYYNDYFLCKDHVTLKHKAKDVQIYKSSFNPMCKFCDVTHDDLFSYNSHLRKIHDNEMIQQYCVESRLDRNNLAVQNNNIHNNVKIKVLEIILYKCSECKIHFLSSSAALKHFEHALFQNSWKCHKCRRTFKGKDANIHQKQHECSNYFKVLNVRAEIKPRKLYKCLACAVHFSNESIAEHVTICETEESRPRESSYCRVCDIFVESSIKSQHEDDHILKKYTPADFEIIEKVLLLNDNKSYNKPQKQEPLSPDLMNIDIENSSNNNVDRQYKSGTKISNSLFGVSARRHLSYNYCNVCKCNICIGGKMDVHLKSLCLNIVKYICKYCGLMFSNKSIASHKKLHQNYKALKLQDFTFFSLQTKKLITPIIPEFPKCEVCEKHFISKCEIKGHLCDINDNMICSICKTKFSNTAYKLHMPFHSYTLKTKCNPSNEVIDKHHSQLSPNKIGESLIAMCELIPIIYTCKNCNLSINSYDEVIEHCHLHTNLNKVEVNGVECTTCQLKFAYSSHNDHIKIHEDNKNIKFTRFKFDVFYFGSDIHKWLKHIYRSLSKNERNILIQDSIYKYETRIKMQVVQEGPSNLTIYKCEKCQCVVDCNSTYDHIATCCPNSEISECTFCDLSFDSGITRNNHEKQHGISDITIKSYRIVMFNREQDRNINNNISNFKKCYVVYECRNCHVLVENYNYTYHTCFSNESKKCNICGLLVGKENIDDHLAKHKLLTSFNENNIKVVLLGTSIKTELEHNGLERHNELPTFNGIVCDYTFYKCVDCEVCVRDVRNTAQHSCLIDAAKSQCIKCDLIFDEGKLKGHLKLHDSDPDLTKETILVKPFSNRELIKNFEKPKKLLPTKIERNGNSSYENTKNIIHLKTTKLYKCLCGLHYIQESSLQEHTRKCSGKIKSKQVQSCSKCGYTFTSDVLFKHILEHHGDKNVVFKYEIVDNLA